MTRRTWTCVTCRVEHTCSQSLLSLSDHSSHHMAQAVRTSLLSFIPSCTCVVVLECFSPSLYFLLFLFIFSSRLRKRDFRHPGRVLPPHRDRWLSRNIAKKLVITNPMQFMQKTSVEFYQDKYGANNWNFVKFIIKVLQKWRNYGNSKVLLSMSSPDRSSSRIRTLLWN